jgi:phenylacetate-CoA ligase
VVGERGEEAGGKRTRVKSLLQRVYPYLPVPIQNAGISAYGYVYKRERFGPAFLPTVAEFEARDRWEPQRMRDYLTATLREVVRRASDAPYYRERWSAAGLTASDITDITPDSLHRIPILPKEELRRNPMGFVPDRNTPQGLLSYFSSGSTGTPIKAICTRRAQQRFAAAREVRSYRWAGTSILRPRAMIGGQPILSSANASPPHYRYNFAERQVYFSAYHIAPATLSDYVAGFNRYQPECVTGYAFSQFLIARLMLEQRLTFAFTPRAAVTSSEALTGAMRDVIRRAWGCRAYQEYGSVENCGLATECEHGSLHVSSDFGIVEIVDDDGHAVGPGVEGRVLCTALLNDAQFLIRYEIGDTAMWSEKPCTCGRDHLPVLKAITGRIEDVVVGPGGRELVRFHGIFINLPHVVKGQVVQEALDRFTVRVIADEAFGQGEIDEIGRRMRARLGPVAVTVERVTELERSARGKVRAVISKLRPQHDAPTSEDRGAL